MNAIAGKKVLSIEAKLTDVCNHSCFHCMNNDVNGGRRLDAERFAGQIAQLAEPNDFSFRVKEVRMTGGEPLCALDSVIEIAAACSKAGIASGVNTNGSLLTKKTVGVLKKAGLRTVKISLDAVDERVFKQVRGANASLAKTLAGIENAVAAGFNVVTRFTLCSLNKNQLVKCYEKAGETGVQRFQVKPLINAGRASRSSAFLSEKEIRGALASLAAASRGRPLRPQVLCFPPEKACGLDVKPCGNINKVYVSTDGSVCLCNYLRNSVSLGNVWREPLAGILEKRQAPTWKSPAGHEILAGCPQAAYF
ncbi:MAG: radical SAM protein [Candidatus Micrarchaeota archaeon]